MAALLEGLASERQIVVGYATLTNRAAEFRVGAGSHSGGHGGLRSADQGCSR